jgi:predicted hydrocarbon binding protein
MVEDSEVLRNRITAISEALGVMNQAGLEVTGRSAPQLMYFAGKDLGLKEAAAYDSTDDLERALKWVFPERDGMWKVTLWKNKEDDDFWIYDVEEMFIRLLFEECPIRTACLEAGVKMGGIVCQTFHGYAAGMLERIFSRKVDLHTEHMGPGACLVMLVTNLE